MEIGEDAAQGVAAVAASTLCVVVHPDLAESEYGRYAGQALLIPEECAPDDVALRPRWHEYERNVDGNE